MLAAANGDVHNLILLLPNADVNEPFVPPGGCAPKHKKGAGMTALHFAVAAQRDQCVDILVANKAALDIKVKL